MGAITASRLAAAEGEERRRNWHGYIDVGGVDAWYVQLADEPTTPTTRVVVEIVGDGASATNQAHNMRQRIANDGMLSRSPTPEELDFLKALQRERGYGRGGFPVPRE